MLFVHRNWIPKESFLGSSWLNRGKLWCTCIGLKALTVVWYPPVLSFLVCVGLQKAFISLLKDYFVSSLAWIPCHLHFFILLFFSEGILRFLSLFRFLVLIHSLWELLRRSYKGNFVLADRLLRFDFDIKWNWVFRRRNFWFSLLFF